LTENERLEDPVEQQESPTPVEGDPRQTVPSPHEDPPPRAPSIPRTRAGSFWVSLIGGIIALVVILVFILENLHSTKVTFFGAHWKIPLGIDLLFAALLGGLIVFVAGATRILQLRRVARRQNRTPHHRKEERPRPEAA